MRRRRTKRTSKRPPKKWMERMKAKVKPYSDDPGAVVGSIWKGLGRAKQRLIARREEQGRYYDVPLPRPYDVMIGGCAKVMMRVVPKMDRLVEFQIVLTEQQFLKTARILEECYKGLKGFEFKEDRVTIRGKDKTAHSLNVFLDMG